MNVLRLMEIDVMEGTRGSEVLVKCQFSKARRVNTARQSKGLPSSHYLIIGVILRATYGRVDSDESPSRLSNDHLERKSFVRTTDGRVQKVRCETKLHSLCAHTYFSTAILLPNFSNYRCFVAKGRRKGKKWADSGGRLKMSHAILNARSLFRHETILTYVK